MNAPNYCQKISQLNCWPQWPCLAVLSALLHLCHLQHQKLKTSGSFQTDSRLPRQVSQLEQAGHLFPLPFLQDLTIQSDASLLGWVAICSGTRTGGHWSVQGNGLHINCLELLTGSFAIKAFVKHQSNNQVLLKIDNRSPVTHINKVEGTHSPSKPVTCSSGVCRGTSSYQLSIYQAH